MRTSYHPHTSYYPHCESSHPVSSAGALHRSNANWVPYQDSSLLYENDKLADELVQKVNSLQALSINIGDEVRAQNALLSGMTDVFDRSDGMLRAALRRIGLIRRTEGATGCGLYCYLFLFVFFFFTLCWILLKFR